MNGSIVRLVQRVSATRGFGKLAPLFIPALDRAVHRVTRGRVILSGLMLPGAVLTSTGARSGLSRRTPLACLPDGEAGVKEPGAEEPGVQAAAQLARPAWLLVGSNFGRPGHPAWTANLLAHPHAEISWKGSQIPVTAKLLRGEEREAAWKRAVALWPPYTAYQARVDRQIRLFRITATPTDGAAKEITATGDGPPRGNHPR